MTTHVPSDDRGESRQPTAEANSTSPVREYQRPSMLDLGDVRPQINGHHGGNYDGSYHTDMN